MTNRLAKVCCKQCQVKSVTPASVQAVANHSGKFISASMPGIFQYQETPPIHKGRVMAE